MIIELKSNASYEVATRMMRDALQALERCKDIPAHLLATANFYDADDIERIWPYGAGVEIQKMHAVIVDLMCIYVNYLSLQSARNIQ